MGLQSPIFYMMLCSKKAGIRLELAIGLEALQGDKALMPAGWFIKVGYPQIHTN